MSDANRVLTNKQIDEYVTLPIDQELGKTLKRVLKEGGHIHWVYSGSPVFGAYLEVNTFGDPKLDLLLNQQLERLEVRYRTASTITAPNPLSTVWYVWLKQS